STTRDFCGVDDVVQANLLAALTERKEALGQVFNIAGGTCLSLTELSGMVRDAVARRAPAAAERSVRHRGVRPGGLRHSEADISRAVRLLGYQPASDMAVRIDAVVEWYQSAY